MVSRCIFAIFKNCRLFTPSVKLKEPTSTAVIWLKLRSMPVTWVNCWIWSGTRVIKVDAISRMLTGLTREEVRNISRISLALSSVKLRLVHKRKMVPRLLPFSAQMQGEIEVNGQFTALSTSKEKQLITINRLFKNILQSNKQWKLEVVLGRLLELSIKDCFRCRLILSG